MMIAACVLMTAALFFYMFSLPSRVEAGEEKTRLAFLNERKETVYENLRDLNFEFRAGKYPEADYEAMRAALEDEAAALLAEIDALENPPLQPKGARA
ncbi:MAG: hypothetical protein LAO06_16870 [Acidobacteriia bacterium]|nr:hypothetical protein [Terriglobia bacterium]